MREVVINLNDGYKTAYSVGYEAENIHTKLIIHLNSDISNPAYTHRLVFNLNDHPPYLTDPIVCIDGTLEYLLSNSLTINVLQMQVIAYGDDDIEVGKSRVITLLFDNSLVTDGGIQPPTPDNPPIPRGIPDGGIAGDILTKKSNKTADVEWKTPQAYTGVTDVVDSDGTSVVDDAGVATLPAPPTVPTQLSQLADDSSHRLVSDDEKTLWTGKYSKPNNGIPSTDLSNDIQTSLGKADTALQYEQYTGTITGITMNGQSVGTSGNVNLGTVITQHQDISGKQNTIDNAHKLDADLVDDTSSTNKFVSQTEKTTWNDKSDFSGNYGDLSNKPSLTDMNNVLEAYSTATTGTISILQNNVLYKVDTTEVGTSTFTFNLGFNIPQNSYVTFEVMITLNSTPLSITFNNTILWLDDTAPTISDSESGRTYLFVFRTFDGITYYGNLQGSWAAPVEEVEE